jgi:NAD(P)H-hydrate repair Nnr-like enzyme with NAD(P)H-hydrate epimerase domain
MIAAFAAMLLAQAPAPTPPTPRELRRGEELGEQWGRCVNRTTIRFARSRESADIIVDAVLGACASEEDAVRGYTLRHHGAAAADRAIAAGRRSIRETVVARLLEIRSSR